MLVRTNDNWLPQVFNEFFNNEYTAPRTASTATPAINIIERKDAYEIQLAAAGMTREDFKVTLNEQGNLAIETREKTADKDNNRRYLRREFGYGKFSKTFILPDDAQRDAITATAQDGILTIAIPKAAKPQPKVINIC